MTKVRDRYQSALEDFPTRGVNVASTDISNALYLLFEWAEKNRLLGELVHYGFHDQECRTVHELLNIAKHALEDSIDPALHVYQRLQQNEEAAWLLAEATGEIGWFNQRDALTRTLNNHAVISRGWVSAARRQLARRAKAQLTGGDGR